MTAIEWTHAPGTKGETWNPVTGCTKVSAGCKHCYAEAVANRFWAEQYPGVFADGGDINSAPLSYSDRDRADGLLRPRRFTDVLCHKDRLALPLSWKKPRTVFVNSMSDLFHEAVPDEFIDRVFAVMALCPQHTFIVLTKRPDRMLKWFRDIGGTTRRDWVFAAAGRLLNVNHLSFPSWPLLNVWLGVSAEDQATADERIPLLLQTPAAIRIVSAEPLLGPVDLQTVSDLRFDALHGFCERRDKIDWLIIGGESGPRARPCAVEWIGHLVTQGMDAGVPVFVKQLGSKPVVGLVDPVPYPFPTHNRKGGDLSEWADDLRVRQWPTPVRQEAS